MNAEMIITNGDNVYMPALLEGVTWDTERTGTPSRLTFEVVQDSTLKIEEGNAVRFRWKNNNVFYGFIFTINRDKENILKITCYDQLRYLKNKDTYWYKNKTASELLKMIANDFNLQTGTIDDTGFIIASRKEDNQTLFDIIQNALSLTMENQKNIFVLYDDFGKIALRNLDNMKLDILIDAETAEDYSYSSTIDNTFNKIKLQFSNTETGKRDTFIEQHGENINKWGVLQYFDTLQKGENGVAKAQNLLKLYNQKMRNLQIKNAFGDCRVRAGSLIGIFLDFGIVKVNNMMLVERCKHIFSLEEHFMDITLRGGEFVE